MIKGHTFTKSYIDKVDKEQLAKKLADFMNELYEVPVIFDKKIYVEQELNNAKINLELLREYLDDEKYSLLLNWYNEYIEYLSEFDNYHFIHGDLWYENYILDDNDELTGEYSCAGVPLFRRNGYRQSSGRKPLIRNRDTTLN